ncbi:hypothetical protein F6B41_13915 [Microbacterium lushaniae]|nr:hypothetical protein F6B41_31575 [Microbacterium lushaniae]KAA9154145.1 hypothetical protein F6B41_13915 [Microbacterium lushaniae]
MTLHHIAMRSDDLDEVREQHAQLGLPSVMEGAFKAARFMYVDARQTLGHYLEYVSAPPEYWRR